jgi:transposase
MARFDLTDFEWSVISPLPPNKPRGVARVDDRRVLDPRASARRQRQKKTIDPVAWVARGAA